MSGAGASENIAQALQTFRASVDKSVRRLEIIHSERLQCARGCSACCVDGITVFEVEAQALQDEFPALLATGTPHPAGACAFLDDDGACRVYAQRPYVCRTQGLPLRWISSDEDTGEAVEYRDICELNETNVSLTELEADECWSIGRAETVLSQLQQLQREQGPPHAGPQRIALRSLFALPARTPATVGSDEESL